MTTFFFRIENRDDRMGPYNSLSSLFAFSPTLSDTPHPSPWNDGLWDKTRFYTGEHEAEVCGFRDLDQLHRWFNDDELKEIAAQSERFALVQYDVIKEGAMRSSRHQAVCDRRFLSLVQEQGLRELYPNYGDRRRARL